jgi:hypothetical protein
VSARLVAQCKFPSISQQQNREQALRFRGGSSVLARSFLFIGPLCRIPVLVWNVVCGRKTLQADYLRLGRPRRERLEAFLQVERYHPL